MRSSTVIDGKIDSAKKKKPKNVGYSPLLGGVLIKNNKTKCFWKKNVCSIGFRYKFLGFLMMPSILIQESVNGAKNRKKKNC